jgi:hypothetical protein
MQPTLTALGAATEILLGAGKPVCLKTFAGANPAATMWPNGQYIYVWQKMQNTMQVHCTVTLNAWFAELGGPWRPL